VTQNRRQWAALSYPEMPARLSPKATARRAYVRIGVKVAKITLPIMLAVGFAAVAGNSGSSGPTYAGDKTARAVMAMTLTPDIVTCEDAPKAAGSVSECAARSASGPGLATFDVTFVDGQGNFTLSWPDGGVHKGNLQN
jgi:hypothetical protein